MESLGQIEAFETSPELIKKLYQHSILKRFETGKVILNENTHIRAIPIVVKGTLKVIRKDEEGKEILLYYISSGESCIMSFLGGLHNETSKVLAQVEDEAEILFLPIQKVSLFIKEYPQWLDYIFSLYHKRFEELLDVVNAIAFKKVDERLLNLLQKKATLSNDKTLHITHEQLAKELGTARVVVSRILKQLEQQNVVRLGRNKILLM